MLALLIMIGAGYMVTKLGMMDEHTNNQMSKKAITLQMVPGLTISFKEDRENFPFISVMPYV
mgnify:CR=1 FL=1